MTMSVDFCKHSDQENPGQKQFFTSVLTRK